MSGLLKYLVVVEVTLAAREPYRKVLVVYALSPADAAATATAIGLIAEEPLDTRVLGVHEVQPPST